MKTVTLKLIAYLTIISLVSGCQDFISALDEVEGKPEISVSTKVSDDVVADTTGSLVHVSLSKRYPEVWGESHESQADQEVIINDQVYVSDSLWGNVDVTDLQLGPGNTVTISVWDYQRSFTIPDYRLLEYPAVDQVTPGDTLHYSWVAAPDSMTQYLSLSQRNKATFYNSNTDSSDATFVDFVVPADVDTLLMYYFVYYYENDSDAFPWIDTSVSYTVVGNYPVVIEE